MEHDPMVFKRGQATADQLQETIDDILMDLRDPTTEAARRAHDAGLDAAEIGAAKVTVKETDQGIAPLLAAIVVGIALEAGRDTAIVVWRRVLWPEIEKRRGGFL